ncbi:MAG: glycoside-pentoside-hexuronide (GPH):cation symporter [Pseudomonadota bacterium]
MTFSRKLGYGLGIYGPMLGWVAALQYLLYFYTEVVGLAPTQAGLIFMIGMVWDAVSDPLIGTLADRTRTRWGRYRPYLLFGALPYGISIAILFTPPSGSPGTMFAIALAAHLVFRTGYTLVYMPYTAMIARMTVDYDSRTDLTAFKTFFVFAGNLTVSFAFYALVMRFGSGEERAGFAPAAALIGVVAALTAWLCFAFTDEKGLRGSDDRQASTIPLRSITGDLIANRPFLLIFAGVALFGGVYGGELAMIAYMAKYWFNDTAVSRTLFTTQAVMSLASVPLWLYLGRRYGKKFVWITGTSLAALGLIAIFLLESKSVPLTAALYGINNVGATGFIMIFYAVTADSVDWGEWQTGRRQEGVIFGAISFANKFAAGVATGAVGTALVWVGFVTDVEQTDETLLGMRVIGLLVPAVGFLVSTALMLAYPISKARHEEIVAATAARTG